jgi:cell division septum initiation protein DivIVA
MAKNNKNNGVIELWGHEFKKSGDGLDRGQVVSYIEELMKKHEALLKRTEHLTSLTKLAEKTIVEADTVAKQVRSEAEEKAKAEAKAILTEAEEKAHKLAQEKRAEALARVDQEVKAVKAKAQQEAEKMLEERTKEIQPELRKSVKRLYGELLSQLESLKQQVVALEKEFDQKLSRPLEKTSAELEETSQTDEETGRADKEFLELFQSASEADEEQPEWELEILPPIDLTQILDIINYLDDLPEVRQTELIPHMEQPKITVFLNKPISMIDILRELPQVAHITEDKTGTNGSDVKPRKAKIELSRKAASKPSN